MEVPQVSSNAEFPYAGPDPHINISSISLKVSNIILLHILSFFK
jgi:hypothetical protein